MEKKEKVRRREQTVKRKSTQCFALLSCKSTAETLTIQTDSISETAQSSGPEEIQLTFWNVCGIKNFDASQFSERSDFYGLSETWLTKPLPEQSAITRDFETSFVAATKEFSRGRASGGLAILHQLDQRNLEILDASTHWLFVKFDYFNFFVIVGTVYFNDKFEINFILDSLQILLNELYDKYDDFLLIIGGDFNARISVKNEIQEEALAGTNLKGQRRSLDKLLEPRGSQLLDFMEKNGMIVLNGRSPGDPEGMFTFAGAPGNSMIDQVWVSLSHVDLVFDFSVDLNVSLSDHFPIIVRLYPDDETNESNEIEKTEGETEILRWKPARTLDFRDAMRWSPRIAFDFANSNIDSQLNNFNECIFEVSNELEMIKMYSHGKKSKFNCKKSWFDEECTALKNETKRALDNCKKNNFEKKEKDAFLEKKKLLKKILNDKKNKYEQERKKKFENIKNSKEFWQAYNECKIRKKNNVNVNLQEWQLFFANVYPPRILDDSEFVGVIDPYTDVDISLVELKKAVKKLKMGKSPGKDQISNVFFKNLPENWLLYILTLFNCILHTEKTPTSWSTAVMTMIHKKGNMKDPLNYRGIALMNNSLKLFTEIINDRLKNRIEQLELIPECQSGFRSGRSCAENIFVLLSIAQFQLRFQGNSFFGLFVDFKRAFDSVRHSLLWHKLFIMGVSAKIIRIMRNIYQTAKMQVRVGHDLSEEIEITEGVLQGEILSPLLFILFLADMEDFFRKKGLTGVQMNNSEDVILLMYADDLIILANSQIDLCKKLIVLEQYCDQNSLTVNSKKTKIVHFRNGGKQCDNRFVFKNETIETVGMYTYLGVNISCSAKGKLAADEALRKTDIATGSVLSTLAIGKNDSWQGIMKLHDSIISATLLYAVPVWGLRYTESLEKGQLNFFKKILCLPRNTSNSILRLELGIDKIELRIVDLTLNWIIHLLKLPNTRLPKKCFLRHLELYRSGVRNVKYNWIAQVNEFLLKVGYGEIWVNEDPQFWEEKRQSICDALKSVLKQQDLAKYYDSTFCQIKLSRELSSVDYLQNRCSFTRKRLLSQLRLASKYICLITIKGLTYKIYPDQLCTICNLNENETIIHILLKCPLYQNLRDVLLRKFIDTNVNEITNIEKLLMSSDENCMNCIYYFVSNCLRIRAFIVND